MDLSFTAELTEHSLAFLKEFWEMISNPALRRTSGMDKVLHFGVSFLLTVGLAFPLIHRYRLHHAWVLAAFIPGIGKEIWDLFYKTAIQGRTWLQPILVDSFWDLVADGLGIFFAWALFRSVLDD